MSMRRITLTLPDDLVEAAEAAVAAGRARSVSAYIATTAGAGAARMTLDEVMAQWSAEAGADPAEHQAADDWARQFLARNDARHAAGHAAAA